MTRKRHKAIVFSSSTLLSHLSSWCPMTSVNPGWVRGFLLVGFSRSLLEKTSKFSWVRLARCNSSCKPRPGFQFWHPIRYRIVVSVSEVVNMSWHVNDALLKWYELNWASLGSGLPYWPPEWKFHPWISGQGLQYLKVSLIMTCNMLRVSRGCFRKRG